MVARVITETMKFIATIKYNELEKENYKFRPANYQIGV